MTALHELSLRQQRDALDRGELAPDDLVEHYLERIERLNPVVGAFIEVTADAARERAAALAARPPEGALWGVPAADKDLVARAGVPTRFGSRLFADNVPEVSDEAAIALDRIGAISLGKTTTPEFGLPCYTETLISPPTRNPWNLQLGSGGSSGGAATAVATGMLPFAPGSDGGGSIRIPAAAVGVVGLKPSRGRLPVGSGIDAPAGLGVQGPIARTVADTALALDAMISSGPAPFALRAPGSGPFLPAALTEGGRFRIGVTTVTPWDDSEEILLEAPAAAAVETAIRMLTADGNEVEDAGWRPAAYSEMFRTIWRASTLRIPLSDADLELVEPITAWLARTGRELTAAELSSALAEASRFERATIAAFAPFDAILTPALAMSPRPIGWFDPEDAELNFSQQVRYTPYTSFVNVAGLPALSVPVAEDSAGLPVSVQLIGRPGGEATLLELGAALERARGDWRPPPLW